MLRSLSGADGLANNLPLTDLKTFWIAIPPLYEAKQIAEMLESSLSQSETTIHNLANEIQLLQEYRTRLIADVVTGKLDVRSFARTLPAEIAEEAAELANSELSDDEFSDSDDELADELAGEPA